MDLEERDEGVIAVLFKRFEDITYPKIEQMREKVNGGGVLDDREIAFLDKTFKDGHQVLSVLKRHPEYDALAKGVILIYEEIMTKSQENSRK
ncbi:hypothetical protein FE810_12710 [Thalassotalea litorea]|uniref:Uncharacterized protein n=1 Tax=Thalassotalea litorea TaxID=2020715 RepID=A0A5R9ILN2_9GAMM|nr:hypothetical protein [Thalassotalea litorea]TLU64161.1 hypothetical protein FE810_12710 [Thalassotalea litorea]